MQLCSEKMRPERKTLFNISDWAGCQEDIYLGIKKQFSELLGGL